MNVKVAVLISLTKIRQTDCANANKINGNQYKLNECCVRKPKIILLHRIIIYDLFLFFHFWFNVNMEYSLIAVHVNCVAYVKHCCTVPGTIIPHMIHLKDNEKWENRLSDLHGDIFV